MIWKEVFTVNNKKVSQYQDYDCTMHLITLANGKTYIKFHFDATGYLGVKQVKIKFNNNPAMASMMFFNIYALIRHIMSHEIHIKNIEVIKYYNNFVYKKAKEKELSKEYMAETL